MILIQDATINNKVQDILIEKNKIKKIGKT